MSFLVSANQGKTFDPAPAGMHPARCIWLIDLGTQPGSVKFPKPKPKIMLGWELPTKTKVFSEEKGEEPYTLNRSFTNSWMENATMYQFIKAWRGQEYSSAEQLAYDLSKVVGKACLLNVVHQQVGDKTYANIFGATALPDGLTCPPQVNPSIVLSLNKKEFDRSAFDRIPEWIQKKIANSPEFKSLGISLEDDPFDGADSSEDDSEIPF